MKTRHLLTSTGPACNRPSAVKSLAAGTSVGTARLAKTTCMHCKSTPIFRAAAGRRGPSLWMVSDGALARPAGAGWGAQRYSRPGEAERMHVERLHVEQRRLRERIEWYEKELAASRETLAGVDGRLAEVVPIHRGTASWLSVQTACGTAGLWSVVTGRVTCPECLAQGDKFGKGAMQNLCMELGFYDCPLAGIVADEFGRLWLWWKAADRGEVQVEVEASALLAVMRGERDVRGVLMDAPGGVLDGPRGEVFLTPPEVMLCWGDGSLPTDEAFSPAKTSCVDLAPMFSEAT